MNKGALAVPKGSGAGRRPAEGGFIPPPRFLCGIRSGAWGGGAGRRPAEGGFIPPPRFLCGIRSGA